MRNSPLKAFASPLKQNESVSDSVGRGNVNKEIKIIPKKKKGPPPPSPKPGKLIDTDKRNRDRVMKGNPIASLFS